MNVVFETGMLVSILLISIRFGAVFLLTPVFSLIKVPVQFRVMFVVGLASVMMLGGNIEVASEPFTIGSLFSAAIHELFVGALLAFGLFAAFAAFLFGGRILDFQMGFGVASLIDPASGNQAPLIGTVLNMMAVITFFLLDGHHMILRGLMFSLEKLPPNVMLQDINIQAVVAMFGGVFIYGLAIVAPAILILLLLDVGMAIAARTMPQMNMFIVGIPLKIFIGLTVLAVSLKYMSPLLEKIYVSIFQYWEKVLP